MKSSKGFDYYITGYPRSRTAWLANFLTYGDSFCFHEFLSNPTQSIGSYGVVGNSDSSIPILQDDLKNKKIVIVSRNLLEVKNSLDTLYPRHCFDDLLTKIYIGLTKLRYNNDVLEVNFNEMDTLLPSIWEFCTGTPYNMDRVNLLTKMNISIDIDKLNIDKEVIDNLIFIYKGKS